MERHEILEMMRTLKLAGMRTAFDELLATGLNVALQLMMRRALVENQ